MTIAAAKLMLIGTADAQSSGAKPPDVPALKPGTNISFGAMKQINASVLNIGYAEHGAAKLRVNNH